jgi:hypothetical protein
MPHANEEHREGPPDTRPYLCLPYWTAPLAPGGSWDNGTLRPLPSAVVSYLCPAIHPGPYRPGQPLSVTVDVRNSGGGNSAAMATVVVYWADPTAGFASPRFFAATAVSVMPGRTAPLTATTATMTATIPASAPEHICLLVAVSHAADRAGTAADPVGDRHWAQRNLVAVPAAPGAPALVPFTVANPFPDDGAFFLQLRPTPFDQARLVAQELGTSPADASVTIRLLDLDGALVAEEGREVGFAMDLGGREKRQFQVLLDLPVELEEGRSIGIDALLFSSEEQMCGSLGLVLVPLQR